MWINENEEHDTQFCYKNKSKAIKHAKMETIRTGINHQIMLSFTYRNLEELLCWTVVMKRGWKNNELATL